MHKPHQLTETCVRGRRGIARIIAALAAGLALALSVPAADLDGRILFDKRCGGCHAIDADHEGPRLRGVVGRPAAAVQTFQYSKALQDAKFTWDETKLEKWLTDTESLAPGNDMSFRVPKPEERAAIIAFLKTLKGR